jgi:hypothetical protein
MAASSDEKEIADLKFLLPLSIEPDARRLSVKEAIAAEIFREPGQLVIQWGDERKYGLCLRSREGCVRIHNEESTDPEPE